DQKPDQLPCLFDPLLWIRALAHVVAHHLAYYITEMAAGIRVVAYVCHSVRGQILFADGQQFVTRLWRDPGIDTVRNDKIKLPQLLPDFPQVHVPQRDIGEPEFPYDCLAFAEPGCSQINAHTLCLRQSQGNGYKMQSIATPQFQYTAAGDVRWPHTEKRSERRQPVGMGLGHGITGIQDRVI